jgi:Ca2+-binding RTX toxin-like protein
MATITGTSGADTKTGTELADTISGLAGDDKLYGRGGGDTIKGGDGTDSLWGDAGNDVLWGEIGNDFLYGGADNDVLDGGLGNDAMHGDAGTDTLRGQGGNDILKGGTGISYLYGGDGTDALYYDPTTANISSTALVNGYLSESQLDGGAGTDTLNLYNKAVYTSGTATKASATRIYMEEDGGNIWFSNPVTGNEIDVGHFKNLEKLTVTGAGRLEFFANGYGHGMEVTGTAGNDILQSGYTSHTLRGGLGNDDFYAGGGSDTLISTTADADRFYFDGWQEGSSTITGFNGAGAWGGDRLYFDIVSDYYYHSESVSEVGGKTVFETRTGWEDDDGNGSYVNTVTVDKVGLLEGVDYFWV